MSSLDDIVISLLNDFYVGWEKAEAEAVSLKGELDEASQQRVAGEERVAHLDAALRECMQQLRFVREEQEKRIHDAVTKTSKDFEKSQMILEEKLSETSKRLAKLGVENSHISNALLVKEKLIEDVNKQLTQMESDFSALMTRLQSTEKDNASLKYEVRVLEKELEIRNEEREFNRRTADASHKQHLESVKKIAKLESECQRLRLLVRKRLPGPAALAKMKNEVEMLGRDSVEMRRRKFNATAFMVDSAVDDSPENLTKRIGNLTEELCSMEEENKNLREALHKNANELQFSREIYTRTASSLSQVELQLDEVSKGQRIVEPTRRSLTSRDLSLASMSEIGSDDKVSCAESWASALISELEHFRNGKQKGSPSSKTVGTSDINLMDDFVEMERLALVSVDKPFGSSRVSPHDANAISHSLETELNRNPSELTGSEIVPRPDSESGFSASNQEIRSNNALMGKVPGWLQDILKVILEQNCVRQRNPDEILEDIRAALAYINSPNRTEVVDAREGSNDPDASNPPLASGHISWKQLNKSLVMDSSDRVTDVDISLAGKSNPQLHLDLGKSIGKIIELIEGISMPSVDDDNPETLSRKDGNIFTYKNSETPTGYMVRVFQWKTSELSAVLHQFVHTCYDLLNGKTNIDKFAQGLTTALDWIMNHCFSLQDVSNMRDAIMKHFDWDESRSESEAEVGMISHFSEAGRVPREQLAYLSMTAASNGNHLHIEELQSIVREENRNLRDELTNLKSAKKDLEIRLQSATDKSESLMNQLLESEKAIASLQTELETLKRSKGTTGEQTESRKLMNEDLDRQLTVARLELHEARQKFLSLEAELDDKNNCYEELEATCLELQLQLERY
jgi:chromosome segregation ATPase